MPTSDLSIVKTGNTSTPEVGDNITFTITIANAGPDNDTSVVVTDNIPSGYTIVSATPSVGSWSSPTWTVGNFAIGAIATMVVVCMVMSTGVYDNTATITGASTDPNPGNDTSTFSVVPVDNQTPLPTTSEVVRIKRLLQSANCCAQKQGQKYIDAKAKGQKGCEKLLDDSVLMTNLIDAVCDFTPIGEMIGGEQASVTLTMGQTPSQMLLRITVAIGFSSYPEYIFPTPAASSNSKAVLFAAYINSLYSANYPYVAVVNGIDVIISGLNYDEDNGIAGSVATVKTSISTGATFTLTGGVAQTEWEGPNAITNEEFQVILDKLNSLCKIPCGKIFSSN